MTEQNKKYKTSKIRSFLFFLLLAMVFWVLTKFSEDQDGTVRGQLTYSDLPTSVSVSKAGIEELDFEVHGNGFQFLSYNVRPPKINIDLSKFYQEGDSSVTVPSTELDKLISGQLDAKVNSASLEDLIVPLDLLVTKKVPVKLDLRISYIEGFKPLHPPVIMPDSIEIAGPSAEVEALDSVLTEPLLMEQVSESVETSLQLSLPELSSVLVSEETIKVQIDIEEFTQKQISIPVALINAPSNSTLKLIPENVVLSFDVPVSRFNAISAGDFRIECDFEANSSGENILVPKLTLVPEGLQHIEWNTKRIEYLIFK
ncbi:MAG: hypothetical protein AAF466_01860 [Bacteroidota bacterium]